MPGFNVCRRLGSSIAVNRLHTLVAILGSVVSGCAADDLDYGETESEISVGAAGGCSTSAVLGLAKQIAAEVDCASSPSTLARFGQTSHIRFASSAVLPYL